MLSFWHLIFLNCSEQWFEEELKLMVEANKFATCFLSEMVIPFFLRH